MNKQVAAHGPAEAKKGHDEQHVLSFPTNFAVWAALMVLTAITVAVAYTDLGFLHVVVALTVATIKAGLVLYYFMHLGYASRTINLMVFTAFVILAIAIGFTFFDVAYR